jgi:hypothetical protein
MAEFRSALSCDLSLYYREISPLQFLITSPDQSDLHTGMFQASRMLCQFLLLGLCVSLNVFMAS